MIGLYPALVPSPIYRRVARSVEMAWKIDLLHSIMLIGRALVHRKSNDVWKAPLRIGRWKTSQKMKALMYGDGGMGLALLRRKMKNNFMGFPRFVLGNLGVSSFKKPSILDFDKVMESPAFSRVFYGRDKAMEGIGALYTRIKRVWEKVLFSYPSEKTVPLYLQWFDSSISGGKSKSILSFHTKNGEAGGGGVQEKKDFSDRRFFWFSGCLPIHNTYYFFLLVYGLLFLGMFFSIGIGELLGKKTIGWVKVKILS